MATINATTDTNDTNDTDNTNDTNNNTKGGGSGEVPAAVDGAEADTILSPKKKEALTEVVCMELDLASFESIRNFVTEFNFAYNGKKLAGLINNAGVMNCPEGKTKDGMEMQFGTNHLGHFLLTHLLLDVLKKSAPARIVNVSSCFHFYAKDKKGHLAFDDLNFKARACDGSLAFWD